MRNVKNERNQKSYMAYLSAALLIAGGAGACLLRGLFFSEEMYFFLTLWFMLCCPVICYLLIGVGIGKHDEVIFSSENRVLIIVGCIPVAVLMLYVTQWLGKPLSAQGTMNEILRWGLYSSFAYIVFLCAMNSLGRRILNIAWLVLGMMLSLSALLTVYGVLELPYAVAYSNSSEVSVSGARLAGVLEYPNAFGAVMAIFLLERLFAVVTTYQGLNKEMKLGQVGLSGDGNDRSKFERGSGRLTAWDTGSGWEGALVGVEEEQDRGRSEVECVRNERGRGISEVEYLEKWLGRGSTERSGAKLGDWTRGGLTGMPAALLRMLPLFPYAAALLLSESRGAWLTAALACAAVLLWKRQLIAPLLAAGAAPVAAAALLYRQLTRAGLAVEPVPGLLTLAGLWAGALLAGLWLCRREQRAAGSARAAMLALAAAVWTAAGTAVLLQVRERITGPSSTVSARGLFYRDAWRLAAEAPWLGRGGETWRSSYLAAQSRPYVGSQVHNGYLDILLNLGYVGLVAILLLLLAVGWLLATRSPRLLPPYLVIVLHSAVDFDWSYGLFWLLLFWLPALAIAESGQSHPSTATRHTSAASLALLQTFLTSTANPKTIRTQRTRVIYQRFFIVLVSSLFLLLPLESYQAMQGEKYYRQAMHTTNPLMKESLLQRSLAWNPRSSRTAIALSKTLPMEESISVLERSLQYSPQNAGGSWELAKRWMSSDNGGNARYWIHRSLRLDRYNKAKWEQAIEGMLVMGDQKLREGDQQEALLCLVSGEALFRQYRILAEYEEQKGGQHNDREFQMTKEADDLGRRLVVLALRF